MCYRNEEILNQYQWVGKWFSSFFINDLNNKESSGKNNANVKDLIQDALNTFFSIDERQVFLNIVVQLR